MNSTTEALSPRVQALFKVWSFVYDRPIFQRTYYGRVHEKLLARTEDLSPKEILDAGCGTGELLVKLARRWGEARLAGLDLSPDMLAKAREKDYARAGVELVEGSVYALPFDDARFDLVTNTISSHFYLEFDRALTEFARVTRPGGTLVMASLGNGPLRFLPGRYRDELIIPEAVYRSPAGQQRALEEAGFAVELTEPLPWPAWLYVCRRR